MSVIQGYTLAPYLFIIVLDYVLWQAITGREEEIGFTITPRLSPRVTPMMLTDLDFEDDIALILNEMIQTQELLSRMETECRNQASR